MPVADVLACHTSQELTRWYAYEEAYGPIDNSYVNARLAQIQELLMQVAQFTGAQCGDQESGNPARAPSAIPPGFMFEEEPEPEETDGEERQEQQAEQAAAEADFWAEYQRELAEEGE